VNVSVAAGATATVLFAVSTLPMLFKARRTRDVSSYSVGNIALGNVGNAFYTVYVLHLPFGPIWALHAFHTVSTFLMLFWYVRYARARRHACEPDSAAEPPDAALRRRVPAMTVLLASAYRADRTDLVMSRAHGPALMQGGDVRPTATAAWSRATCTSACARCHPGAAPRSAIPVRQGQFAVRRR
jgi:hypothetical protein